MKCFAFAFCLLVAAAFGQHARAQVPGGGGTQPGGGVAAGPIDGGASLLLAGGAAYALKRLRRPRQA